MLNTRLLLHFNKTPIIQIDAPPVICFQSGIAIDADGCPLAYHPENIGLDDLKHGAIPEIGGESLLMMNPPAELRLFKMKMIRHLDIMSQPLH
jgi:hypothetical protein